MSDAKPVESKVEAVAKAADAAVALTSPAAAPVAAVKAGAWAVRQKRLMFIAAGAAVGIAGAYFAVKHFTADPGKATGQVNPPAVAQLKPEETAKPAAPTPDSDSPAIKPSTPDSKNIKPAPVPTLDLEIPDLKPPVPPGTKDTKDIKPAPVPSLDLEIPDLTPPTPGTKDTKDIKPAPVPSLDLDIPDIKPPIPDVKDTKPPRIVVPTLGPDTKNIKPPVPGADQFKAPDELPTTVTDKKDRKDTVIRIGGTDPMPSTKKDDPPKVPDIDILPPPPVPDSTKKEDPPKIPDIDIKIPDSPSIKVDDPPKAPMPKIGPSPMTTEPLVIPPVKNTLPDDPPTIRSPMIGDPPPPPLIGSKSANKDNYDEDWHTKIDDSFVQISKEYFKTPDFAAALEAYNKERRKPGERIIRVPPTWVLEDQYPNLIGTKTDKPEPKGTASPKIEPPVPAPGGERPAPPPAPVAGNNEYRVKAEAGETIREIARKLYGDANAWQKLWKLNPDLDPTLPIPSGTTLRLDK
jgi:hypothetical protein